MYQTIRSHVSLHRYRRVCYCTIVSHRSSFVSTLKMMLFGQSLNRRKSSGTVVRNLGKVYLYFYRFPPTITFHVPFPTNKGKADVGGHLGEEMIRNDVRWARRGERGTNKERRTRVAINKEDGMYSTWSPFIERIAWQLAASRSFSRSTP